MVIAPGEGIRLMVLKNDRRVTGPKNGDVLREDCSAGESWVLASGGVCMMDGFYASEEKTKARQLLLYPTATLLKDRGIIIGRVFQVHAFPQDFS